MERQTQQEEEDNIVNKWAQEDVNTLYYLMNNNISHTARFSDKKLLNIKCGF
jgi:hypothetical protein